jgi:TRAP-type C4-dicarboxylate transport system substrate-binding protein
MTTLIVILAGFALVCAFHTESQAQKPIELSMASLFPPDSPSAQSLNLWAERVKSQSKGLLSIRHYPANTLIAAPDMRTGIKAGVADIGCSFIYKPEPGFEPSLVMSQLILGLSYENCIKIFEDIWNKFPALWEGQWKDFKLLWITTIDPNLVVTVKKPVRSLEDLKGLQIRIPNAVSADMLKALGGTPVSMPTGDWIVSLDKGTTDGGATSLGSLLDYKIAEKIHYITYYSMGPGVVFLIMNKDKWNALPPELQKVINHSTEWGKQNMIDTKTKSVTEATEYLKKNGVEFIKLSPAEYERWNAAVKPIFDKIAKDLSGKGYPGEELVKYAMERAKFYNAQ